MLRQVAKDVCRNVLPRRLYCSMRRAYGDYRTSRFPSRQVRHCYGGFDFEILLSDSLGVGWYDCDWQELPEVALLRQHRLRPGARVFNLGAHQCIVALMLARTIGPTGQVVAVEPEPLNIAVAKKNKELNRAENLHILQAVGTDRSGPLPRTGRAKSNGRDWMYEWRMLGIEGIAIDDMTRTYGQPDVLFLDVEGFECAALRGAVETLKARPDCFVEVHVGAGLERDGGSAAEVLSFFPRASYDLLVASEKQRQFVPLTEASGLLNARFFLLGLSRSQETRGR